MAIPRHKTAILRRKFSKPVQLLLDDGLLTEDISFFDYGCGQGEDIRFLNKLVYSKSISSANAAGWDPHFARDAGLNKASIVNLGYITNIIEDSKERAETIQKAYELADDLLVVSVMIRDNNPLGEYEKSYADGIITSWNTFQKYFTQSEFKQYLESVFPGSRVNMVSLGVAYIFKTDRFKQSYIEGRLQSTSAYLSEHIREEEYKRIIGEWIDLYHELGRPPSRTEFKEYNFVIRAFGSLENATSAIRTELNEETVKENAERRKSSLLVSIARNLVKGGGKTKVSDLEAEQQTDVRLFYGKFTDAQAAAHAQLKTLSDLDTISSYINESKVGKVLPDDIYIHVDALSYAPEMLQILVALSKMIIPEDLPYNIVKIARNSHHVTLLNYPDFMSDPHPALEGAMKVILHKNDLKYRDYKNSENPPILHRKETFLYSEHARYEEFSSLTFDEAEAGLLSRKDIGHRTGWLKLLQESGYKIIGHRLVQK